MPKQLKIYNVRGQVKATGKTVVLELNTGDAILELHFGNPAKLMDFLVLMMEEMSQVFPDFEASKLWKDDSFK